MFPYLLKVVEDGDWVAYEDTLFGALFDKLGWAGTGIVLLVATIAVLVTAVTAGGNSGQFAISKSSWRPVILMILGLLGLGLALSWAISRTLPKCAVVEDDVCWRAT